MEHIYPAFERGRIMKKELLWALRDYSYSALQLQYQDYSDGIIRGCKVRVEDNFLIVGEGIIKCQNYLFLITEEERIEYAPTDVFVSLKFRVASKEELPDYIRYTTGFVLDKNLERKQNELEICRFKLKEGAKLRTEYKDFYDIQTEFDTVNLADAAWAGVGGNTLSKEVTDYFARKVLECGNAEDKDIQFAYLLLQSREAVSHEIIENYISKKMDFKKEPEFSNSMEMYRKLEQILIYIKNKSDICKIKKRELDNRMIVLD